MRSRPSRQVVFAIGAAVILAIAGGAFARASAASPSAQQAFGVKFLVTYEGSVEATWHNSSPVEVPDPNHTFRCGGGDASGALTSSVRPGSKRFFIRVGHEPGGSWLSLAFQPPNGSVQAVVASNRTAQEWYMRYSGHECKRFDFEEPGCGAHTLNTDVAPVSSASGRFDSGVSPIYHVSIAWPLEPETIGCGDGIVFPGGYRYGWEAAQLRLKPLYRCGIRKPRSCKLTIGRDRTYVYDTTDRGVHYTSTVHVKWSVTFLARGR